ncbi:hypothetical protein ACI3L3_16845 [Desulfobaculum sp. SPO524]|uniref:hypothetical protein n=1 Tax=Desulfobaculum sp. SPO524 TaxID=3378071 RepID=UPI003852DAD5
MKIVVSLFMCLLFPSMANSGGCCVFYVGCENVKAIRHHRAVLKPEEQIPPGDKVIERNFGMIELTDEGLKDFKRTLERCNKKYLEIKTGELFIARSSSSGMPPENGAVFFIRDSKEEVRLLLHAVCPLMPIQGLSGELGICGTPLKYDLHRLDY